MKKRKNRMLLFLCEVINILLMTAAFGIVCHHTYLSYLNDGFYQKMEPIILLVFSFLYFLFGCIYEGFQTDIIRIKETVFSQGLALILTDGFMFFLIWMIGKQCPSPAPVMAAVVCQILLSAMWAIFTEELCESQCGSLKTAVLYYEQRDCSYLKKINTVSEKFQVEKWIRVSEKAEDILDELEGIEVVFMRGLPSDEKNTVLKYCLIKQIEVYMYPKIGDVLVSGTKQAHMFYSPIMHVDNFEPSFVYAVSKRVLDICASLAGLIVFFPFFVLTAIAVKAYDGGPILYKQTRLTKDGRRFEIYKFRSMRVDAERDGIARLAQEYDTRITPIGRLIRATHLDELPQLFNILKGDMTLVGPRPERPEIAEKYMQELPEFSLRLQVKAGLTGYAQVYGKYNSAPYDKLQMDLWYIAHPSIRADLKLIMLTVKTVFFRESSQGIKQGQVTACPEKKVNQRIKE